MRFILPQSIPWQLVLFLVSICHAASNDVKPKSLSPELDRAAAALANSKFEEAAQGFAELSANPANSGFLRGLGTVGKAETELARGDTNAALRIWRQLAAELSVPAWQREVGERRGRETERRLKGLPARDPAFYRAKLPKLPEPGRVLHVAPGGSDEGDGSAARPFATLGRAREAVRHIKQSNDGVLPKGGVKVLIADGTYALKEPFRLTAEDSGTAEGPVVYEAQTSGKAVFEGGLPVGGWRPIADPSMSGKLDPAVRHLVLEADLKAGGITEWGDATAQKKRPELFVNGIPQTLARWPNEGFVHTGEILGTNTFKVWNRISGCRDGKFRFAEDRPKRWLDEPDVRLYGYWFWDWFEEYQKVEGIDAVEGSFTLAKPFSSYGYRKGQRYFAVNVFRELDQPGEWYLDRRIGRIYWLPPSGLDPAKAEIVLSLRAEPFVVVENAEHVVLIGLMFQEGRGDGIHVRGGSHCLVAGCTLRRLGGDAVVVEGGREHTVFGCTMQTLGHGGMRVNGGDRKQLTPGGHVVENCTVSDISRLKRTYAPAVHLDGCGNRIAHNLFERIPSSAMRIEGNDHLIELNRVRHVVQESDDQGGIDMFGNPLYRGVVIRWNHWSDIIGGTECGAAGIRLDDMISGIVLQGNLFERCGAVQFGAVQIHGGKDNFVDNNLFIDCHAGASFSRWDEARWLKSIEPFLQQAGEEPYATRYPDLARLKVEANVNNFSRNVLYGCKNIFLRDGGIQRSVLLASRSDPVPAELVSVGDAAGPALRAVLFEPLPASEIGPYTHPWRAP